MAQRKEVKGAGRWARLLDRRVRGRYGCVCDDARTSYPTGGTALQRRGLERVQGPRVGRLATENSLKPDATRIRARSARAAAAAVSLLVGVVLIFGGTAEGNGRAKRDAVCYELWTQGLITYDRAFRAMEDLPDHPRRAEARLANIDATWARFDRLGRACARVG